MYIVNLLYFSVNYSFIKSTPIYKNPYSYFLTCIIATDAIYVRDKFSKRKNQSQIDIGIILKVQNELSEFIIHYT